MGEPLNVVADQLLPFQYATAPLDPTIRTCVASTAAMP